MDLKKIIEKQANFLADENRKADPEIIRSYWFPDDVEVRLLAIHKGVPVSHDGIVHPYFFRSSPKHKLPAPSSIALINKSEFRRSKLPRGWGGWRKAVEIGGHG